MSGPCRISSRSGDAARVRSSTGGGVDGARPRLRRQVAERLTSKRCAIGTYTS
ncbi:MAG: hypothetical protein ACK52I_06670 [Pseudomonadota bacterium]